jgi:hypothetical protein
VIEKTWKPVLFAPKYEVSDFGDLRKRVHENEPWLRKPYSYMGGEIDRDGYRRFRVGCRKMLAHRLVYSVFVGPLETGLVVCHLNGDRLDNRPANLLQTTQRENIAHKVLHGTSQVGERHGMATLTNATVAEIKKHVPLMRRGKTGRVQRGECQRIARMFGVRPEWVSKLASGRFWKDVA